MTPLKLLYLAHAAMIVSLVLSLGAIALAYVFEANLSLGTQVGAHMSLVVLPAIIKIGYVARLTALKQLGRPVN